MRVKRSSHAVSRASWLGECGNEGESDSRLLVGGPLGEWGMIHGVGGSGE